MERNIFLIMSVGRVMRRLFAFFLGGRNWHTAFYGQFSAFVDTPTETNEVRNIQGIQVIADIHCTNFDCPDSLLYQLI